MEIGRAVPADATFLSNLAISSKQHWGYSDKIITSWIPDLTISKKDILHHLVYKLSKENRILGFYMLKMDTVETATLEFLFVAPSSIGQGFGKQLLEHAMYKAKEASAATITLLSDPNAVGFYTRNAFIKIGEKESSISGRFLPIMRLIL